MTGCSDTFSPMYPRTSKSVWFASPTTSSLVKGGRPCCTTVIVWPWSPMQTEYATGMGSGGAGNDPCGTAQWPCQGLTVLDSLCIFRSRLLGQRFLRNVNRTCFFLRFFDNLPALAERPARRRYRLTPLFFFFFLLFTELLSETIRADKQLSSLAVLGGVRTRAVAIVNTVRVRVAHAVVDLCQTFSPGG